MDQICDLTGTDYNYDEGEYIDHYGEYVSGLDPWSLNGYIDNLRIPNQHHEKGFKSLWVCATP